jgi:hypothetical protein
MLIKRVLIHVLKRRCRDDLFWTRIYIQQVNQFLLDIFQLNNINNFVVI